MHSDNERIIPQSTILIIDEVPETRDRYCQVLSQEGHTVGCVGTWAEALENLKKSVPDLVLLSYGIPDEKAENIVGHIKKSNSRIRVVLLFDKSMTVSRRKLLQDLPIQGCHEKEEGIEKLFLWVDMVLKSLGKLDMIRSQLGTIKSQIRIIEKNKEGLRYIISAMPETVNQLQPLDKFVRGILIQLTGFIEAEDAFLAIKEEEDADLRLLVGTGKFDLVEKDFLASHELRTRIDMIQTVMEDKEPLVDEHEVCFPLVTKDKAIGVFYLEKADMEIKDLEVEMLRLFVSQAAITIENSNLFKLATLDGLTGLYVRRYFMQRGQESLQFASRLGGQAISLLMLDIDHFKRINDSYGHPEGDKVLGKVSSIIRSSIRSTDIAGRLGGEEFAVLLVDTKIEKAKELAENIRLKIEKTKFVLNGVAHTVTMSIGVGAYPSYYIEKVALKTANTADLAMHDLKRLITTTDKSLYVSKEQGRNRVTISKPLKPRLGAKE